MTIQKLVVSQSQHLDRIMLPWNKGRENDSNRLKRPSSHSKSWRIGDTGIITSQPADRILR